MSCELFTKHSYLFLLFNLDLWESHFPQSTDI